MSDITITGDLAKQKTELGPGGDTFVVYTNFDQIADDLKFIQNRVKLDWVKMMKRACDEILVKNAKIRLRKLITGYKRTIKSKRTGNLVKGIESVVKKAQFTNVEIYFGNKVSYGIYFEKGTGIYGPKMRYIKPVKKRILAWKSGGLWYFAKQVAGMPPRPYLLPTAQQEWGNVLKHLLDQVMDVLKSRYYNSTFKPIMKRYKKL